jgi:hypothetical protein
MVTAFLTGSTVEAEGEFFNSGTLIVSSEKNKLAYESGLKNALNVINPYASQRNEIRFTKVFLCIMFT